jgi:gluconolactonase
VKYFSAFVTAVACLSSASRLPAQDAPQPLPMVAEGATLQKLAGGFKFTEGPAVDSDGNVYFTDQPNDRILKWTPGSESSEQVETWLQPSGRSNGMFFLPNGDLLACADGNNELWRIRPDKSYEVLAKGYDGRLFNGPNDVWAGDNDMIYFTDPLYPRPYWTHRDREPQLPKRVYRLDSSGSLSVAAEDFEQPNGIVGDAARKLLFVADIGAKKTYQFTIGDGGQLENRQLFCEEGSDGMTLDREGNLYLTGRGVIVFDRTGKRLGSIAVPEGWTANVCFGGPNRDQLFITASGSVYVLQMNVQGL